MIEFDKVNMSFSEKKVLDNLSFKVNSGEILAIIGPSGCGKSTILNIISGIYKVDSGKVIVNGETGYMFQQDNLLEWYKIIDNIKIGLKIQHKKNDSLINRLITEYGLSDYLFAYPKELSGGMRQRVALIRTLVTNPKILLLDEPFSALDAQTKIGVCKEVKDIIKKENKTAIIVTHDIKEALKIADRIIVLSSSPANIVNTYLTDKDYYDEIWRDLGEK